MNASGTKIHTMNQNFWMFFFVLAFPKKEPKAQEKCGRWNIFHLMWGTDYVKIMYHECYIEGFEAQSRILTLSQQSTDRNHHL